MKYSPWTFKKFKIASFLHFLFYIAIIRGVTRDRVEYLDKRDPLATVPGPLANAQKKNLRNDGESGCGWLR